MSYARGFLLVGALAAGLTAVPASAQIKRVPAEAKTARPSQTSRVKKSAAAALPAAEKPRLPRTRGIPRPARMLPGKASVETKGLMAGFKSQLFDIFSSGKKI